ncbi:Sec-independent secretion TatD [Thermobacillus xylanilyticus]|jgi:TatD DNase family protein|uniref:Sec-independent secretion TatD n=1 Tax=Thermobacillus xylanilyticus TaxID=76633 RepID=A0ABN7RIF1_THEXY|nr:TatD family hydrolase [Thermobacillus xylanilyticus]CAG5078343.1 Sec-independent secretion TatD [Thermobacillus xylanilyticus]
MAKVREAFGWIDAHIHVDKYEPEERERLLAEAYAAGGEAVVGVSMNLESSRENRELALRHAGRYMPAYGHHPEIPLPEPDEEKALFAWIRRLHEAGERFAIGEVGLPYYTRTEAESAGRPFDEGPHLALLGRFAALAAELDRPIVLHAVYEDAEKACDILEQHGVKRAHFHWFKGPEAAVRRMIAHGWHVSVTPDVVYEPEIQALVRAWPLELLMAETDGPWQHEGPFAGRPTTPALVREVIRAVAELKGLGTEETAAAMLAVTKRFYGI